MLETQVTEEIAERMLHAQDHGEPIALPTETYASMSPDDGYAVQDALRRKRRERGERISGMAIGVASFRGSEEAATAVPYFAFLTAAMACLENAVVDATRLHQPQVQAGLGFVLCSALDDPGCTPQDVLRATECIVPVLAISERRYTSPVCDLASLVAANAGVARYVAGGRPSETRGRDLRTLGVVVEKNAGIAACGAGAAAHDEPSNAVVRLVQHLAARGESLPAGNLILAGGITDPVAVVSGDVLTARFQDMGSISLRFA